MRRIFTGILVFCLCCVCSKPVFADEASLQKEVQELKQMVQELKQIVETQQKEIAEIKQTGTQPVNASPLTAEPSNASNVPSFQKLTGRWNPDIGVIADVVLSSDSPKADTEGADRISVRELELVFGSAIDPYSRMDATLAISDFEEMSIEEAYITRFGLPLDTTARIGRFLPRIGKSISVHRDTLDTVDEPMVIEKYFGHHGYNKTGADIAKTLELPTPMTHQLTLGILEGGNGEEGTLFGTTRRHPTIYSSLKNYADINDNTGLEMGLSYLVGSRDEDSSFEVNVLGMDGTLTHRYADQRHVKFQGEAYFVSREESYYTFEDPITGEFSLQDLDDARHLWGGYFLADWRFSPQWATGFRLDDVQLIETAEDFANVNSKQQGYTGYLTFYQSEFARWRVQYSHIEQTDANDDDRVFVQGTFAIGEHKHKIQ